MGKRRWRLRVYPTREILAISTNTATAKVADPSGPSRPQNHFLSSKCLSDKSLCRGCADVRRTAMADWAEGWGGVAGASPHFALCGCNELPSASKIATGRKVGNAALTFRYFLFLLFCLAALPRAAAQQAGTTSCSSPCPPPLFLSMFCECRFKKYVFSSATSSYALSLLLDAVRADVELVGVRRGSRGGRWLAVATLEGNTTF